MRGLLIVRRLDLPEDSNQRRPVMEQTRPESTMTPHEFKEARRKFGAFSNPNCRSAKRSSAAKSVFAMVDAVVQNGDLRTRILHGRSRLGMVDFAKFSFADPTAGSAIKSAF